MPSQTPFALTWLRVRPKMLGQDGGKGGGVPHAWPEAGGFVRPAHRPATFEAVLSPSESDSTSVLLVSSQTSRRSDGVNSLAKSAFP